MGGFSHAAPIEKPLEKNALIIPMNGGTVRLRSPFPTHAPIIIDD
jgi:hypothetical protein